MANPIVSLKKGSLFCLKTLPKSEKIYSGYIKCLFN